MNEFRTCQQCNTPIEGKPTKRFCSRKCKFRQHSSYAKQQERAVTRKRDLVAQFGGCCAICGYDKNYAALSFHHKDPTTKEFQLDARHLSNRSPERIQEEAAKCELLCANCHMEVEYPHCENSRSGGI